jgi:hypothetical protein
VTGSTELYGVISHKTESNLKAQILSCIQLKWCSVCAVKLVSWFICVSCPNPRYDLKP